MLLVDFSNFASCYFKLKAKNNRNWMPNREKEKATTKEQQTHEYMYLYIWEKWSTELEKNVARIYREVAM